MSIVLIKEQGMDVGTCVTTRDWNNDGHVQRIDSTVYYVHRVSLEAEDSGATEDLTWLQDNIFGTSDPVMVENFRNQVYATSESNLVSFQKANSCHFRKQVPFLNLADLSLAILG